MPFIRRLSPAARSAVEYGEHEAAPDGNAVTSSHLLLGLFAEKRGVAAKLLVDLGLRRASLLEAVHAVAREETPASAFRKGGAPFTVQVRESLDRADRVSRQLEDHYVGTGHLLIGLIDTPGCEAHRLLTATSGLTAMRKRVEDAIAERPEVHADISQIQADAEQYPPITAAEESELARVIAAGAAAWRERSLTSASFAPERERELKQAEDARVDAAARLLEGGHRIALTIAEDRANQGHNPIYAYGVALTALATRIVPPGWAPDWPEGQAYSSYARSLMDEALERRYRDARA